MHAIFQECIYCVKRGIQKDITNGKRKTMTRKHEL